MQNSVPAPGVPASSAVMTAGAGFARRDVPAGAERKVRRPNTAPAYYLGHPAALWITVMRPRRERTASRYLTEAAVSGGDPTRDSGVLQHT